MSRETIRARVAAANAHVNDLCTGKARWTMRVPMDLERDSDVVIVSALDSVDALLAHVEALESWRTAALRLIEEASFGSTPIIDEYQENEARADAALALTRAALEALP